MTASMVKQRDGGIELFRCLLMFLVVLHHSCLYGAANQTVWATLLFAFTIPAVDGFIAISGWYGIRFRWSRVLKFLGLMLFYSVLIYVVTLGARFFVGGTGSVRIHTCGGWFGSAYLALMLLAPILNAAIQQLSTNRKQMLLAWGLYAGVMALSLFRDFPWGNPLSVFAPPGWFSHSFNTLVFIYFTAGVARQLWPDGLSRKYAGRGLLAALLLLGSLAAVRFVIYPLLPAKGPVACNAMFWFGAYDAPWIWGYAVVAFLFFLKVTPPAWLTRVATFCGPSMFGVYLFHESPLRPLLCLKPELWLGEHVAWLPIVFRLLLVAIFCFTVSLGVDLLRRGGLFLLRQGIHQFRHFKDG